jgi:hypothetical protein
MQLNRTYKSSVFTHLFSDENRLRELYNAITGSNYGPEAKITINTLQDALFMDQLNDISFTIGDKLVVLIEHQSTINENMPLRFLLYIARIYEKLTKREDLYREKLFSIPHPEFFVLYNGKAPYDDQKILKLSDAFANLKPGLPPELELMVKVYNINEGHNTEMTSKAPDFEGYVKFIDKTMEERSIIGDEALAVKKAIQYCIDHGILADYLRLNASEVENMLLTDKWDWNMYVQVKEEEARAEGRQEGLQNGIKQGLTQGQEKERHEVARNLKAMNMAPEQISKATGLPLEAITKLN